MTLITKVMKSALLWRPSWPPSWIPGFAQQHSTGTHQILEVYHLRNQNQYKLYVRLSLQGSVNFLQTIQCPTIVLTQYEPQQLQCPTIILTQSEPQQLHCPTIVLTEYEPQKLHCPTIVLTQFEPQQLHCPTLLWLSMNNSRYTV